LAQETGEWRTPVFFCLRYKAMGAALRVILAGCAIEEALITPSLLQSSAKG